MKIAVIGTGYVGLVTGTCFAEMGNDVCCVDIDEAKLNVLRKGTSPIFEPELDELLKANIDEGRLNFTSNLKQGIDGAEVIFLALPTPPSEDGSADLSYITGVAADLGEIIKDYVVIVDKSTVPVGTAEKVSKIIKSKTDVDFDVVSNPEFLREGLAISDFMKPDRIVIGSSSDRARKVMDQLYSALVREGSPLYHMDERSAEMTKYAANSFLAAKISFMNEIANLCELVGADVDSVRVGIGADARIGSRFLYAGIGYGGSCFPKDVEALKRTAADHKYDFKLLTAITEVNAKQKKILASKITNIFGKNLKGKKFALWGLAFKPDTDDIREAPALSIIKDLVGAGAQIVAYDPKAIENTRRHLEGQDGLSFAKDEYEALNDADALLIVTEWPIFRSPDFDLMKKKLKKPIIFDGRNLFDLDTMREKKFSYYSIGRKSIK